MPLTYKILKIEQNEGIISVDDTPVIELELTDLNSEKAFKIKVRIITPKTKPEIGIVFDGPTNWINRSVEIHHYDKKPIESWKVDDWLFDENPLNK